MLDENGLQEIKIVASSDLDENVIHDLKHQGAEIDMYAVGTRVITAFDQPALGGVYKLVEVIDSEGVRIPKIKVSDNIEKIVLPGRKKLYRIVNRSTGKAEADYITRYDEELPEEGENLLLFDPFQPWKQKTVLAYRAMELQEQVIDRGKWCGSPRTLEQIRKHREASLELLWDEQKRKSNPQEYYVDLSFKLWSLKRKMIEDKRKQYNN